VDSSIDGGDEKKLVTCATSLIDSVSLEEVDETVELKIWVDFSCK
jgi:hypothetical protein